MHCDICNAVVSRNSELTSLWYTTVSTLPLARTQKQHLYVKGPAQVGTCVGLEKIVLKSNEEFQQGVIPLCKPSVKVHIISGQHGHEGERQC